MTETPTARQIAAYEVAGEILHALSAACTARAWQESGGVPPSDQRWQRVRTERARRYRALAPEDEAGVTRFIEECKALQDNVAREAQ